MDITKYLLPKVPRYFKANLHTHSTLSDGQLSPQQVKQAYRELGYQILCITDHNIIVDHSAMTEPDFLMLTGVEINHNSEQYRSGFDGQSYHLNLISRRPDNLSFPGSPEKRFPQAQAYKDRMHYENMSAACTPEAVNAMIARANEMGYLVMYNHPTWSGQRYPDYAPLKGLWAMELRNSECCLLGNNENNPRVFKDLVELGNPIYPVGADDMHSPRALGQSWIMVGAPELTYESVITALENGDFYMSCGPQIHSLELSGTQLHLTCSDARTVTLESHGRFARRVDAVGDELLCSAEFDLTSFLEKADRDSMYIHLTVTAPNGTYAATRPYYLSELK